MHLSWDFEFEQNRMEMTKNGIHYKWTLVNKKNNKVETVVRTRDDNTKKEENERNTSYHNSGRMRSSVALILSLINLHCAYKMTWMPGRLTL